VGVDVADLGRVDAAVGEGHRHRACRVHAGGVGLGDVSGVGRKPVAEQFGVDLRAARARVLEILEDEDRARLAHDEPVALRVERPAAALGVVVPARERPHRAEPRDADARDRGFRPAGEHHVRAAQPDRIEALPDRHVRGGARRALRRERAARAELHRDPRRAHVRDDLRDRERVDPVGAALAEHVIAVLERLQAADPGRDRDADAVGLRRDREAGVGLRHAGGGEDHLREPVHPPGLLALDPYRRVEVLQLAGEVDRVVGRVELRDRARARLSREQVLPRRLDVVAER
jgi:hypothetical protein